MKQAASILTIIVLLTGCKSLKFIGELPRCENAEDCDDGDPCTIDECRPDGYCSWTPSGEPDCLPPECEVNLDCDDGDPCTMDVCNAGHCWHEPIISPECTGTPECINDIDCDDGDPCTRDQCVDEECFYEPTCECETDFDCDDGDPCTIDVCSDHYFCRNEPFTNIWIEVIESTDTPVIYREAGDQRLLRLRFSAGVDAEITAIIANIGADCSDDGLIESDPLTGIYHDAGGPCGDEWFEYMGLRNDRWGEDLLLDAEIRVLPFTGMNMGPIAHPLAHAASEADDGVTLDFFGSFPLIAGETLDIVLVVDNLSYSDLRANIPLSGLSLAGENDICPGAETPILEGLTRINSS
jgi:hypothetical protein